MTKEEKQLLLIDLCARLPYGIYISPVDCGKAILIGIKDGNPLLWDTIQKKEYDKPWDIEFVKPYLRPMSSMTEEEKKELNEVTVINCNEFEGCSTLFDEKGFDCLNEHYFDYRGLIERGLALEAPKGMYKELI